MIRVLIGGSPCVEWSIAKKGREVKAEGKGWELFKCYLRAKELYQPDYFLYENNYSISNDIKKSISSTLGQPCLHINSALLSAQNRDRIYVTNIPNIQLPKDKLISFADIAENNIAGAEGKPFCVAQRGRQLEGKKEWVQKYEKRTDNKSNALTTVQKDVMYCVKVKDSILDYTFEVKDYKTSVIKNNELKSYEINLSDGKYKVRNLTILERRRLQTIPDSYKMLGKSKDIRLLGNGWTVDVIAHILSYIPNIENEEIEILSMFDGMACGMIALKKLGVNVKRYLASEIDEYAIETVSLNYPEIIHIGDAFNIEQELSEYVKI